MPESEFLLWCHPPLAGHKQQRSRIKQVSGPFFPCFGLPFSSFFVLFILSVFILFFQFFPRPDPIVKEELGGGNCATQVELTQSHCVLALSFQDNPKPHKPETLKPKLFFILL